MSWAELTPLVRYDLLDEGSDAVALRLAGELDVTSPQLVLLIEQAGSQFSRVVLDLRRVSFLDASGLSLLDLADRRVCDRGSELVLRRPHRAVRRVLRLAEREEALTVEEPAAWTDPAPDIVAICARAAEEAISICGATAGQAQLADSAGALHIVAAQGASQSILDFFEIVDDSESACGAAWATGNAVYVPDATRSPIFLGTPSLEAVSDAGVRSGASIPLWGLQGEAVGMLSVQSDRSREWTRDEQRQLRFVASATSRLLAEQES